MRDIPTIFRIVDVARGDELDPEEVTGLQEMASQAQDLWTQMTHPVTGKDVEAIRTKGSDLVDKLYVRYLERESKGWQRVEVYKLAKTGEEVEILNKEIIMVHPDVAFDIRRG